MTDWRIIYGKKNNGLVNTALEQTVLEEICKGNSPPTLIFTEWTPTVSLGKHQSYDFDLDLEACKKHNVTVMRRLSGGQAVFINEGYLVFSAIGPASVIHIHGKHDATIIREDFCSLAINALKNLGVPAEFHEPDNIVIRTHDRIQTIGNSGQIFKKGKYTSKENGSSEIREGYFVAQGSIRYKMTDFEMFLDVLKVNGEKLNSHRTDVQEALADVYTYNPKITKEDLTKEFIKQFQKKYDADISIGELTTQEKFSLKEKYLELNNSSWIKGQKDYQAMGICYFFLGGKNIVNSLEKYLPKKKPSTLEESTMP